MAETVIKPNLKLIKGEGTLCNLLGATLEASPYQQVQVLLQYHAQSGERTEEEMRRMKKMLEDNPSRAGYLASEHMSQHQGNVIKQVKLDPKAVLGKLEQGVLIQLAQPYIGNKSYQSRMAVLKGNDPNMTRSEVMGMYDNDLWREVASGASSSTLTEVLAMEITEARMEHMQEDLGLNTKTGQINTEKAAGYLAPHIKTDEERLKIGLQYAAAA